MIRDKRIKLKYKLIILKKIIPNRTIRSSFQILKRVLIIMKILRRKNVVSESVLFENNFYFYLSNNFNL